jgi:hypothetical protein
MRPAEFRLKLKGKLVGYLEYFLDYNSRTDSQTLFAKFVDEKGRTPVSWAINFDKMEQWTGRFDRHGKKIYEGDRVKLHHMPANRFENCIMEWSRDSWRLSSSEKEWISYSLGDTISERMEVIGEVN